MRRGPVLGGEPGPSYAAREGDHRVVPFRSGQFVGFGAAEAPFIDPQRAGERQWSADHR